MQTGASLKFTLVHLCLIGLTKAQTLIQKTIPQKNLMTIFDHYTIFLLVSHGLVVDLIIITVTSFKSRKTYWKMHERESIIMMIFMLFTSITAWLRKLDDSIVLSYHFDFVTLSLVVFTSISGYRVLNILGSRENGRPFWLEKKIHRIVSILLFILMKMKLAVILWVVIDKNTVFCLVLSLYVLVCLIVYGYFMLFSDPSPSEKVLQEKYKKHDSQIYKQVLHFLEHDEFNPVEGNKNRRLRSEDIDVEDEQHNFNSSVNLQWYLYANKLCELPVFPHAGGNFLIPGIIHKDITKLALGISPMVYMNLVDGKIYFFKHTHGRVFKNEVKRSCFGVFSQKIFKRKMERTFSFEIANDESRMLLGHPQDRDYKRHKVYEHSAYQLRIEHSIQVSGTEFNVSFIRKESENSSEYYIDLKSYWPKFLGKYVLSNFQIAGLQISAIVHFLNPNYLRFRNQFILNLDKEIYDMHAGLSTDLMNQTIELDDAKVLTCSNFCVSVYHSSQDLKGELFAMSDYLGFGLGCLTKSCDSYLLVVKNQGILPFVDLFELIFQKTLFNIHGKNAQNEIFGGEYRLLFANKFTISVYWFLNWEFLEGAKSLGMYHLQIIKKLQNKFMNGDQNIIGKVWIEGSNFDEKRFDQIKKLGKKAKNINQILKLGGMDFDRVIVNGDDQFMRTIFEGSKISRTDFAKMIFW